MPAYDTLLCDVQDGIATLTLNRPTALNAVSPRMADELVDLLGRLSADETLRVLVLRGAGDNFCAGGDVREMAARTGQDAPAAAQALHRMARYRRLTLALHRFDRPVIAAVDGVAFGAGMSLALLSDLVLLSDRARLCMAFQRVGLVPDCGALYMLPRLVGLQQAKALALSAREIGAAEALALGLAIAVLPPERLHAKARQLAEAIACGSSTALSLTKRALDASLQSDLETMLALEATSQAAALTSAEHREAVDRFARKEPARCRWPELPDDRLPPGQGRASGEG